jgi:hypothetical protein
VAKVKTPKFEKPKSLKRLKGLGKSQGATPMPKLASPVVRDELPVDTELSRLSTALGDEKLAKKVIKLKLKYPDASTLEVVMIEWFDRKRVKYVFQQSLLGGRAIRGGQVTDFIVDAGMFQIVIEAQGSYWHNRLGSKQHDEGQKFRLLGITFQGKKISKVVNVWETKIMQPSKALREQTMQLAISGIEVGQ